MTSQPQTPLARKASTIRSHSPYSEGKGPIVNRGFVEARVRAIEGEFRKAKALQHPESENGSSAAKKPWDRSVRSLKQSASFKDLDQQRNVQASNSLDSNRSKESQHLSYGKWQRSTSSLRSPSSILPTGLQSSSGRRIHSMWDLHTHYSGSPHGGRKRYRDYSNLRRISAGSETSTSEIISPQPLSPYKQPVNTSQHTTDDSGFWSETQAEQQHPVSISVPRKSIAEELGEMLDVSDEPNEASMAWATEDEESKYPFPVTEPLKLESSTEARRSEEGLPFDHEAYSQYVARSLPGFSQPLTRSGSNDIDDGLRLKRMRGRRAVPDNTVESVPSSQQEEFKPFLPLKKKSRAVTASYSGHSLSNVPRRATLPAPSIDPFNDQRSSEDLDEAPDALSDLKSPKVIENSKPNQHEAETAGHLAETDSQPAARPEPSHSRRSSTTSRAPSIALSRPLSRAWRRLSTWRLGFGDRQAKSVEPPLEQRQETHSQTGTDVQPQDEKFPNENPGKLRNSAQESQLDQSTIQAEPDMVEFNAGAGGRSEKELEEGRSLPTPSDTSNLGELDNTKNKQFVEVSEESHSPAALSKTSNSSGSPRTGLTGKAERFEQRPQLSQQLGRGRQPAEAKACNSDEAVSASISTSASPRTPHTSASIVHSRLNSKDEGHFDESPEPREHTNHLDQYPGTRALVGDEISSAPAYTPLGRPTRPPPLFVDCSHANSKKADRSDETSEPRQQPIHEGQSTDAKALVPREGASTSTSTPPALQSGPPNLLNPFSRVSSDEADYSHERFTQEEQPIHRGQSTALEARSPNETTSIFPSIPPTRPPTVNARSYVSLRPSPAHPTTELSTPSPTNWTPSPSRRRESVLSRTYNSLADRYQVHSTTPSVANHSRPQSPSPSEADTIRSVSSSAYLSLKSSHPLLGPPSTVHSPRRDYELPRYRDREQRIKRVKVVVSLDGGPDLVVDATVEQGREGDGWRVRESVRDWENAEE